MLGASGIACAAIALLPAVIAALIALIDLAAHGLLGLSGGLLGLAGGLAPGTPSVGGGLPAYARVPVDPADAAIRALGTALAPTAMIVLAVVRMHRHARLRRTAALAVSLVACATDGWPGLVTALPGALAAVAACLSRRHSDVCPDA